MNCSANYGEREEPNLGIVERIKVNKIGLILVSAVALTLGFAPATLILGRLELLVFAVAFFLIISVRRIRSFNTIATEKPSALEFILGGLGTTYGGATLGFLWLITYVALFLFLKLVEILGIWLGFAWNLNAEVVASYISAIPTFLGGYVIGGQTFDNLTQQLYPFAAGVKSAFYDMIHSKRTVVRLRIIVPVLFLGIIFAIGIITNSFTTWWFNLILLFSLSYVSLAYSKSLVLPIYSSETKEISLSAIKDLFVASGYEIVESPRTGHPEFDPLLLGLDLFALKNERGYAIEVVDSSFKAIDPVDIAHSLENASFALERYQDFEGESVSVAPLIVCVGDSAWLFLSKYQKIGERIQLVKIPDLKVIDQILKIQAENEKRKAAIQYLSALEIGDSSESTGKLDIEGGDD